MFWRRDGHPQKERLLLRVADRYSNRIRICTTIYDYLRFTIFEARQLLAKRSRTLCFRECASKFDREVAGYRVQIGKHRRRVIVHFLANELF